MLLHLEPILEGETPPKEPLTDGTIPMTPEMKKILDDALEAWYKLCEREHEKNGC